MDKAILTDPTKPLPDGYVRGFHEFNRAWYSKTSPVKRPDEFNIGIYLINDGTAGEFTIKRDEKLVPGGTWFLKAFDDSWATFPRFADLFSFLAEKGEDATTDEIRAAMLSMGMTDLTGVTDRSAEPDIDSADVGMVTE